MKNKQNIFALWRTKTVKKLKLQNREYLTEQNKILDEMERFYSNLYTNRDSDLSDLDLNNLLSNCHTNKLMETDCVVLKGKLTKKEITVTLKKRKNNRSPALDGFSCEFFKVFWIKLKYFVLLRKD